MAGGLGTRMQSEMPKHLHPLLGRRLVDWVLETRSAARCRPGRRRFLAPTEEAIRASLDGGRGRGPGAGARDRRRGRVRAAALDGFEGDVLVLAGDAPLLRAGAARGARRGASGRGRRGDVLTFEPEDGRPTAASSATATARPRRSSRPATRGRAARDPRAQLLDLRLRRGALARARPARPANAQGELYLTDTVAHIVEAGLASACTPRRRQLRPKE